MRGFDGWLHVYAYSAITRRYVLQSVPPTPRAHHHSRPDTFASTPKRNPWIRLGQT